MSKTCEHGVSLYEPCKECGAACSECGEPLEWLGDDFRTCACQIFPQYRVESVQALSNTSVVYAKNSLNHNQFCTELDVVSVVNELGRPNKVEIDPLAFHASELYPTWDLYVEYYQIDEDGSEDMHSAQVQLQRREASTGYLWTIFGPSRDVCDAVDVFLVNSLKLKLEIEEHRNVVGVEDLVVLTPEEVDFLLSEVK